MIFNWLSSVHVPIANSAEGFLTLDAGKKLTGITHKNVLHYWKHSLFNDLVFELKMQIQIGFYFMRLFFLPAFLIVCKRSM